MRTLALGALLAALAWFSPDAARACTLAITGSGDLALDGTYTRLTSEPGGAASLTAIIPRLTNVTITVSAPARIVSPPLYDAAGESLEVRYEASILGLLHLASQPWTSGATSFSTGILPGLVSLTATLSLHNRIVNAGGFAAGSYSTRTIVTCHP